MSGERYIILGSTLTDLAEAVREKTGSETDYTPAEMATAIRNLPTGGSVLGTKNIILNGSYTASVDGLDGYSSVNVNVPNSYGLADEGKVVSGGELVAQAARTAEITQNGTYDTTNNNSVTVNVSGGGGGGSFSDLTPLHEDITTGYVNGSTWYYSTSYSNLNTTVFTVEKGKTYLFMTGAAAERLRVLFTTTDIAYATKNVSGVEVANIDNASPYQVTSYTATRNGFISVYVGSQEKRAYGFVLTGTMP